jgi:hypothetical protein
MRIAEKLGIDADYIRWRALEKEQHDKEDIR